MTFDHLAFDILVFMHCLGSSMENLLRQGSERIEKTKSSFIQLNPFSSKLFHSCENLTESFIHDLKPFPGTKLISGRSASGLAKGTSGLVKGASGPLLDTKSASKAVLKVSEHSLSNVQILGKILKFQNTLSNVQILGKILKFQNSLSVMYKY